MNRAERDRILGGLAGRIRSHCGRIADDIRAQRGDVRDRKILAARMRITSGYYDSAPVVRAISEALLSDITPSSRPSW